jgi:hypothetical protein
MLQPVLTKNGRGFSLTLDFLRQRIHPQIAGYTVHPIKQSGTPATIYQVRLAHSLNGRSPHSAILKVIAPEWPEDKEGPNRELNFYRQIRPLMKLHRPRLYDAGIDAESQCRFILMEELTADYTFFPPAHLWTQAEAMCVLRTYAYLHVQGQGAVPPAGERGWMWSYHRPAWEGERLPAMAGLLVEQGVWRPLPGLERLIERTVAADEGFVAAGVTVTHHDVFPPNVALPRDLDNGRGAIIDWEMAGWGMAEMDLAYFFLQPFGSSRRIERESALAVYWAERGRLEGGVPVAEERMGRQAHADALLALSLIPVAHRAVMRPFAAGSFPSLYWDSMLGVLHQRLQELCRPDGKEG